jgi:hypothetical protein
VGFRLNLDHGNSHGHLFHCHFLLLRDWSSAFDADGIDNWRQPTGPGSSIVGKDNHPVVHIAYEDALAYGRASSQCSPLKTTAMADCKHGRHCPGQMLQRRRRIATTV